MKAINIKLMNLVFLYTIVPSTPLPLENGKLTNSEIINGDSVDMSNDMNKVSLDINTLNRINSNQDYNIINRTVTSDDLSIKIATNFTGTNLTLQTVSRTSGKRLTSDAFKSENETGSRKNDTRVASIFTFYVKVKNSSKHEDSQDEENYIDPHVKEDKGDESKKVSKSGLEDVNSDVEQTSLHKHLKVEAKSIRDLKTNDAVDSKTTMTNVDGIQTNSSDINIKISATNKVGHSTATADAVRSSDDLFLRYTEDSGIQMEEPTSRIVVTVMKRSGRYWEPWELNYNVCPPSLCTASEENRPKGTGDSNILSNLSKPPHMYSLRQHPGGSVFYNGDIVLDSEYESQIYGNSLRIRWKRATARETKRLWKNGIVPYTFSDILPKSKKVIKKAMQHIEKHTCIRFRRKKLRDEDYIRFISEPGCWSMVGRVGGEQKLSIGRGCERLGTAIHEISHSLGFWHEQARPDRDKYVKILEKNISPRYLPDFAINNKTLVSSRGFPYDYESVMHYSEKAFTNLGEVTIKVIGIGKKLGIKIGQRDELSNLDIAQLRDMYKCNDKEDENVTFCPSGWKKYGRSCYKFVTDLKYQFAAAARHCEKLNSHLLYIENSKEDAYIKKRVKKKFPKVAVWRTAGRKFQKEFAWYTGDGRKPKKMEYTKWKKGHPAGYSSMALVHNKTANRVRWEGVWLGSASQYPDHAYPFICERRARRKCIKGSNPDGRDYRGKLDHTIDGITCQKWSSQYPHPHKLLPYPYKDTGKDNRDGLGDHNYCRNPSKDRKRRPWCFTDKKKYEWQYCDISICSKSSSAKHPENKGNSYLRNPNTKGRTNKKDAYSSNEINPGSKGGNRNKYKTNEIQKDQQKRQNKNSNKKRRLNSDKRTNSEKTNRKPKGDINAKRRPRMNRNK